MSSASPAQPLTRIELAGLFVGEGVELGVAAGAYSATILKYGKCRLLWSVDAWSDHHDVTQYKKASQRLAKAGRGRCIVLRMREEEAAPLFPDASLDFVYSDLYAHTGQGGIATLERWWPKLRPGGLLSGHDYYEPRWPKTVAVVNAFAAKYSLHLMTTTETPTPEQRQQFPSWFVRKPIETGKYAQ